MQKAEYRLARRCSTNKGNLLGKGRNRRVQENDASVHGETDAFRKAGRQKTYLDKIMVTTLAPCWYCSGLVRQFKIGTVVVGEAENFDGGIGWLKENGVEVIKLKFAGMYKNACRLYQCKSRNLE
ncbi:MAG: nucleoside deaminase [Pyrinomonadaceae bacterium]